MELKINTWNDMKIAIAMKLLEDVERAERELNNYTSQEHPSLDDLDHIRYLQEQVDYRYFKYLDYVGIN